MTQIATTAADRRMTAGRAGLLPAVLGVAVGGGLILLASGRQWAHAAITAPGAGEATLQVTGHNVSPALPGLGIALLALAAAVLAASGTFRRVVGLLVLVVAAAAVAAAVTAPSNVDSALQNREVGAAGIAVHASANGWWVLAAIGGAIALVVGAFTVVRGQQWSGLGARYDAPARKARATDSSTTAWDALDRGEDPTEN